MAVSRRMKVFLVEDSQTVRERLCGMLACIPGIALVGEADNEDDAMQGISAVLPDAVILDLTLVGGNGMGVLRRIREESLNTQVIVLTNYSNPLTRRRCLDAGADYFLDKSNEISKLEEVLAQFVETLK